MNFGPTRLPSQLPPIKLRAALVKRRQLQSLADDAVPPEIALLDRILGVAYTQLVAAAARLRMADHLAGAPRTVDELAALTGAHRDALARTMRALCAIGVFEHLADGRFGQNRVSFALRSDHPSRSRDYALLWATQALGAAWGDFDRTLRNGESAFERMNGADMWQWFDVHPGERELFAEAIAGRTAFEAPSIARAYPFGETNRVCDVGGGSGLLLSEVLLTKSYLRGVLFERPGVLDLARKLLSDRGVADRVELVAGDYFASVPMGCDAYLLKGVLHAWDDARCLRILGNCRAAMKPGNRVIVIDAFLDKGNPYDVFSDAQMMVVGSGGRERTQREIEQLLEASRFRPNRVFDLVTTGVVEGVAI
jgi:O-methyltransferase domain